ncbi:Regulator of sigma-E protease RseP [wastewater metagenome]|uniref:Regulator of sigma-E protease RseP n=2 Tax=unclassified sequences TaxID=12908 RepID=A0A5B8R7L0_9ZZZZ|nr:MULTISPECIES: RIP metalloprotease RseP [Arhodomonas]MCS4505655.1 RIP metalloprotease RseP [Arhodomonas aquaeolei]QEA04640.1 regulator of sigma-E protease RseP [uncultured organism]
MSVLTSIIAFAVALGLLVTVHEFGHFWVARRLGVKVLRFSVGFGRIVWRRQGHDGTEYAISAIPLGGYVKMLDEREGDVPEQERHRAFNRQPLWVRNAILFAGPGFNFIFAVLAYWAIFVTGTTAMKPVIGQVEPDTPAAAAGLQSGERIVAVGGEDTRTWDDVLMQILSLGPGNPDLAVTTVAGEDGPRRSHSLDVAAIGPVGENPDILAALGMQPWRPRIEPVIDSVMPDGPAAGAGLQPGDRIEAVDGTPMPDWARLVDYVRARPGESVTLSVERDGEPREVAVTLAQVDSAQGPIGRLGVSPRFDRSSLERMQQTIQYGPLAAVGVAAGETWRASALTVKMLGQMITGEASVKNLSGPINIAQYAGQSAQLGVVPFLRFLAIVSISLGVLNLLPVPVLDGGHLMFNALEWVRGRPLSEAAQAVGQQVGLALLGLLMAVAFYNDIARLFGPS